VALEAVTVTVETPPATRSISTSLTPGRARSSSVTAPTQCPQVRPVTANVLLVADMMSSVGVGADVVGDFFVELHPQPRCVLSSRFGCELV
jgi:hypothetical protein